LRHPGHRRTAYFVAFSVSDDFPNPQLFKETLPEEDGNVEFFLDFFLTIGDRKNIDICRYKS
jgi:hypothetical protein